MKIKVYKIVKLVGKMKCDEISYMEMPIRTCTATLTFARQYCPLGYAILLEEDDKVTVWVDPKPYARYHHGRACLYGQRRKGVSHGK